MRSRLLVFLCLGACQTSLTPSVEPAHVLNTDEAQALEQLPSQIVASALDRSTNPCDDFYQFACGGYIANTKLSSDSDAHVLSVDDTQAVNNAALESIIDDAVANRQSPINGKVADYFQTCLAFQDGSPASALTAALADEISQIRTLGAEQGPSAMLGRALLDLYTIDGAWAQPFVQLYPAPNPADDQNVTALVVMLPEPLLTDPSPDDALANLNAFYPGLTVDEKQRRATMIAGVEAAFLSITNGAANVAATYETVGLDGLQAAMPHFDWVALATQLGIGDAKNVVAEKLAPLTQIDALFAGLSADDLADYLEYKLITRWSDDTPSTADQAKLQCAALTALSMPGVIEPRFAQTVVGKKNIAAVTAMAKLLLATFAERLKTVDFLDEPTRQQALLKTKAMQITPIVEPSDDYEDIEVDPASFMGNEVRFANRFAARSYAYVDNAPGPYIRQARYYYTVNASYSWRTNAMTIYPGTSHGLFFGGKRASAALNFGGLGWTIGHELTHGFDNNGRHFDGAGGERDWWSAQSAAAFEQKTSCMMIEYSAVQVDGVTDPATGMPAHVDGTHTLSENIADNGGLQTAYQAGETYFARGAPFLGFSPQQQFFVVGAQTWCETVGSAAALAQLEGDVHAPGKTRTNVPFSNFDKFAEAFACKPGDKMVAEPACTLW